MTRADVETKTCAKCGHSGYDFPRADRNLCRACLNAYNLAWMHENMRLCHGCYRMKAKHQFNLMTGICIDCPGGGLERLRVGNRNWRASRRWCNGCRKYRRPDEFRYPGKGVRCDHCLAVAANSHKPRTKDEREIKRQQVAEEIGWAMDTLQMSREDAIAWIANRENVTTRSVERWLEGKPAL